MLQKNKITTYLLYAIGEIFLVVIGILIAVSINNWNIRSQNKVLQKKILISLKQDLQSDTAHFNRILRLIPKEQIKIDSLISILTSRDANQNTYKSVIRSFPIIFIIEDTQVNDGSYQSIINSGHINILAQDLQEQLSGLNQARNLYKEYISESLSIKNEILLQLYQVLPPINAGYLMEDLKLLESIPETIWDDIDWSQANLAYLNYLFVFNVSYKSAFSFVEHVNVRNCHDLGND